MVHFLILLSVYTTKHQLLVDLRSGLFLSEFHPILNFLSVAIHLHDLAQNILFWATVFETQFTKQGLFLGNCKKKTSILLSSKYVCTYFKEIRLHFCESEGTNNIAQQKSDLKLYKDKLSTFSSLYALIYTKQHCSKLYKNNYFISLSDCTSPCLVLTKSPQISVQNKLLACSLEVIIEMTSSFFEKQIFLFWREIQIS